MYEMWTTKSGSHMSIQKAEHKFTSGHSVATILFWVVPSRSIETVVLCLVGDVCDVENICGGRTHICVHICPATSYFFICSRRVAGQQMRGSFLKLEQGAQRGICTTSHAS